MTRLLLPTTLLALAACAPSDGGQVGEENLGCLPVSTTELEENDETALGFAPSEILNLVVGEHNASIEWADDSSATLSAELALSGSIRFEDREWRDDGNGLEPALEEISDCVDVLVFPMTLSLESDDGRLAESIEIELEASTANAAILFATLDSTGLTGTLDLASFAPAGDFDELHAFVNLTLDSTGLTGSLDGQASGTDGDIAFAEAFPIATIAPQ